jgi:hypothetical protein
VGSRCLWRCENGALNGASDPDSCRMNVRNSIFKKSMRLGQCPLDDGDVIDETLCHVEVGCINDVQ